MPSCRRYTVATRHPFVLAVALVSVLVVAAPPPLWAQDDADEQAEPAASQVTVDGGDDDSADTTGDGAAASEEPRVRCAYRVQATGWGEALASSEDAAKAASAAGDEEKTGDAGSEEPCAGEAAAALGDRVALRVDHLDTLLSGKKCENLVLFIDRTPLEDNRPAFCLPSQGELVFDLERGEKDDADWRALLASPMGLSRRVSLSVGPDAETMLDSDVDDFVLRVLSPLALSLYLLFLAVALGVFLNLAATTPMLRDGQSTAAGRQRPYSLARCQMAWWFFLVVAAFGFIYMVLGELDSITGSILGLIGISSGTALGAVAIDSSKKASQKEAKQKKAELQTALDAEPMKAALARPSDPHQLAAAMDARMRLAQATSAAADMEGAVKGSTRGLLRDLLWDGQGISFHRFQIVVWTLVLGAIFLWSVYTGLKMPEFSATLLALMGISSGTYLGFKFPERFGGGGDGGNAGGDG